MKVLVCVDNGEYSKAILPAVARLATTAKLDLHLLRVLDPDSIQHVRRERAPSLARGLADGSPPEVPAPATDLTGEPVPGPAGHLDTSRRYYDERAGDNDRLAAQTTVEARHELTQLAAEHGVHAEGSVVFNEDAADAILEVAERSDFDLIAITTHARGGFGEVLHGSTAKEVLGRSRVPVLLVRPDSG